MKTKNSQLKQNSARFTSIPNIFSHLYERGILKSCFGKFYLSLINLTDLGSIGSTLIYFRVSLIHLQVP